MPQEQAASPGVVIAPAASRNQILVLDQTLQAARREIAEANAAGNDILKALTLAKATQRLRQLLTPELMSDVMQLQNTPLGFRTDRDPSRDKQCHAYPVETVRDVVITAMIDGAKLVGNEFNLIAANYYRTLEQFERRIRDYPGLTDFRLQIGVPVVAGESALADMRATWKLNNKPNQLACCKTADNDTRIPIRVNKGMGLDAILGKARRKFLARVLDLLDGTSFEVEDAAIEGQVLTSSTLDPPATYETGPTVPTSPTGQMSQLMVDAMLADVEGTLLTCETVTDATKIGDVYLDRIAKSETAGECKPPQAECLRKIVAGLVEARCQEIRKNRGEGSNKK